jgi:hypothetical protein
MSPKSCCLAILVVLAIMLPWNLLAQTPSGGSTASQPNEGVSSGGYKIHQSIEAGYRYSDQSGSDGTYDTVVNLHSGPRILEQTLSMQSETHEGPLFDNLYINSFGGGDPNNEFPRSQPQLWVDWVDQSEEASWL